MNIIKLLKKKLKENTLVFATNSFIKSYLLKKNIIKLEKKYFKKKEKIKNYNYNDSEIKKLIIKNLRSRKLLISTDSNLKILYVGTNYFQDHSGIIQSLRSFGNVELFYKNNGEYGFNSSPITGNSFLFDQHTIQENSKILLNKAKDLIRENKLNILIGQMWSNFISCEVLREIRNMGVIVVNISMDDMLPEHWQKYKGVRLGAIGLATETDLTLNTTKERCEWYFIEGYPSIFWPLGSSNTFYKNIDEKERDIDVSFVGSKYGIRKNIVEHLKKNGINVQAYGHFWENGPLSAKETSEIFSRSKIILGCGTIGYTNDVFTLKLRDFDAPISGGMYLTHENYILKELYEENREIVLYKDKYDCLKKIKYYLLKKELREKIATLGKNRALKDHNWDLRFQKLFSIIRDLS